MIIFVDKDIFAINDVYTVVQTANTSDSLVPDQAPECTNTLNRIGYGIARSLDINNGIIEDLNAGLYLDWRVSTSPVHPNCAEYFQVVRMKQKVECSVDDQGQTNWDRDQCTFVQPYEHTLTPSESVIEEAAQARPGSIWLLGNEIDRYGQDHMLPEYYAEVYHNLYTLIKGVDPTAQIAIAGVVQPTPLRLAYLTTVWDTYQSKYGQEMPVDVWNVHNFIMQEKLNTSIGAGLPPGSDAAEGVTYANNINAHVDMGIFQQQIVAFRQWMKDRGQQDKPLIVSEYGVLFWHCEDGNGNVVDPPCDNDLYDPVRVENFMISSFDSFRNTADCNLGYVQDGCRLVQRWAWYALNDDGTGKFNPETHLYLESQNSLSHVGRAFQNYVANHHTDDYRPEGLGGTSIGQAISLPTTRQDYRVFLPVVY